MRFDQKELNKLLNYKKNSLAAIEKNLGKVDEEVFGDDIDRVTPEDTGDLIDSKRGVIFDTNSRTLSYEIGYSVDYAPYVHAFEPVINWTKASSDYQFLENHLTKNLNKIIKLIES